jgi:hypothetical protein
MTTRGTSSVVGVVGERRVEDLAVTHDDLLHQGEAEALARAALDLPLERLRVDRAADLLSGRELDDAHRPKLDVDVDDGAVRRERELQGRVALAVLVERLGRAVVRLDRRLDRAVAQQRRQGDLVAPARDRFATQLELVGRGREPRRRRGEQLLARRLARRLDRAAGHGGLLVYATNAVMCAFGTAYGPAAKQAALEQTAVALDA